MTGTIKKLVLDKGFGFIRADKDKQEYFFHRSDYPGGFFEELHEGSKVEFEFVLSTKGSRAGGVKLI